MGHIMAVIKIIYPKKEKSFGERLETIAGRISETAKNENWDFAPESMLKRNIALTADHISRLRALHKDLMLNLLRHECYVDTSIMHHDFRHKYDYSIHRFKHRMKLQDKLGRIEQERKRLKVDLEDRLQPLHDRLLSLLDKHAMLNPRPQKPRPPEGHRSNKSSYSMKHGN